MADFDTPFGNAASRRFPSDAEHATGFACGPLDITLFNGLFYRLEAEIGSVLSYAGVTQSDADMTQLRQAIITIIEGITGLGNTDGYVLLSQARARLPIFPEIVSSDYKINLSAPATGTVRVPAGVTFMHRGIYPFVTVETNLSTSASKTYHVRWDAATNAIALKDLSNGTYNPGAAAETAVLFDSTYDDMLIARVVTNASNVATITSLANAHSIAMTTEVRDARGAYTGNATPTAGWQDGVMPSAISNYNTVTLNWARKPHVAMTAMGDFITNTSAQEWNVGIRALSRYQVAVWTQGDADGNMGAEIWL